MSSHTKQHLTDKGEVLYKIIIESPEKIKKYSFVSSKNLIKLKAFLAKYGETEDACLWQNLAYERVAKYKKSELILRGARHREGISQKELANRSGVAQENISKMEKGLRKVGPRVAKKLAQALKINPNLFNLE